VSGMSVLRRAAVGALLAWLGIGAGARAAGDASDAAAPFGLALSGQALAYAGAADVTPDSPFNPANALAQLPRRELDIEFRPTLSARQGPCSASLQPRAHATRGVADAPAPTRVDLSRGFVNGAALRCRLGDALSLGVAREVPQWGSAFYASPSNPFFFDTGRTNPLQELYGRDIASAALQLAPGWSARLLRNYTAGPQQPEPQNFVRVSALKLDWTGDTASGGLIASRRATGVQRLGAYATWTGSDALLLYADLDAGRGSDAWYPTAGPDAANGGFFARNRLGLDRHFLTALVGAAYTFESAWAVNVEFLSGNEGYTRAERAADRELARAAAAALGAGDGVPEALRTLAIAGAPGAPYLGNRLLFVQLARSEVGPLDLALRAAHSFAPGAGSTLSFSASYALGGRLRAFALGARNLGGAAGDFARYARSTLDLGLRLYF